MRSSRVPSRSQGACLAHVRADAEQRVQQAGVLQRRRLVGEAPEEEAEHDVAPQLAHAVEQREEPVADHADAAGQPAGQPRCEVRRDAVEVQLLRAVRSRLSGLRPRDCCADAQHGYLMNTSDWSAVYHRQYSVACMVDVAAQMRLSIASASTIGQVLVRSAHEGHLGGDGGRKQKLCSACDGHALTGLRSGMVNAGMLKTTMNRLHAAVTWCDGYSQANAAKKTRNTAMMMLKRLALLKR